MQEILEEDVQKLVVLLSGGLDSTVLLHWAVAQGVAVHTLSFAYGQRHERELACAQWQAERVGVLSHRVVDLSFESWDPSSLSVKGPSVEKGNLHREHTPNTYVPARNMVFLAVAASVAESLGVSHIGIGVSEVDSSGYVDCTASFLESMEHAINAGTERCATQGKPIRIVAPFLRKTKVDEVQLGQRLGVDFSHTWSCYQGEDTPCGVCDSCLLRARAFEQAGVVDTLLNSNTI